MGDAPLGQIFHSRFPFRFRCQERSLGPFLVCHLFQNDETGHEREKVVEVCPAQEKAGYQEGDKTESKHVGILDNHVVLMDVGPFHQFVCAGKTGKNQAQVKKEPDEAVLRQKSKVDAVSTDYSRHGRGVAAVQLGSKCRETAACNGVVISEVSGKGPGIEPSLGRAIDSAFLGGIHSLFPSLRGRQQHHQDRHHDYGN